MSKLLNRTAAGVLSLMIPIAAWADLSGVATLSASSSLNLETGATSSSGGDLLFSGGKLTAQGSAKVYDSGDVGLVGFNLYTLELLQSFGPLLSTTPLTVAAGDVVAVLTNGGHYAKVLVTAISGTSVTLQYLTYGVTTAPAGPSILGIQNNYSLLVAGLPNYGIAPGSLFLIYGTGLAAAGNGAVQSSAAPGIPTTLNGASISVTVNGVTTHPAMYYALPTQIAAVLPSSTPAGTGTITVTYNGVTSSGAAMQVVSTALGFDTYYGSGTGLAAATDPSSGALFTNSNSAKPGQAIVLWGSGLGADTADSDTVYASPPHPVNVPLQIYVGGIQATILYQGASGYPGVNQIDVTIPQSVQPGCGVSVVAVSGNVVSNTVIIPVNAGGGACSDPALGVTSQTLGLNTASSNLGSVGIVQATGSGQTTSSAGASFVKTPIPGGNAPSLGNCTVSQSVTGLTATQTGLDAGTITVTGPSGKQTVGAAPTQPGAYGTVLPTGFVPATGGSFTFTGTGGKDVGAFTATVNYANPITWTNMNAITSVNRSQGVTVTWSGGDTNGYVLVSGTSVSQNLGAAAGFVCYAPVSAGQFTVPSYILLGMPVGTGTLTVENATTPAPFSATGLDYASGLVAFYFSIAPSYQ